MFKKVVGPDQQSSSCLLVALLYVSATFQAMAELHRLDNGADIHFDDYISLNRYEQSNPGCLAEKI